MYFSASLVFPRVDIELYSNGIIFYYLRIHIYVHISMCKITCCNRYFTSGSVYVTCALISEAMRLIEKKKFQISHGGMNKLSYILRKLY